MRINRFLTLLAVLALTAALLPGCGGGSASGGVVPPSPGRSAQEPQSGSGTEAAEPAPAAPGESIQTNGGEVISLSALEHQDAASDTAVYYTSGISPEAMVAVYDALGVELAGDNIAVKLSTGEPPASNYLDPALIADLETVKFSTNPYNVNRLTLRAGEAALAEQGYYDANCRAIMETRDYTRAALEKLGFACTDSRANFLFARHPRADGETLYRELKARGVLIRHFDGARIRDYNRITVGTRAQMDTLLSKLEELL